MGVAYAQRGVALAASGGGAAFVEPVAIAKPYGQTPSFFGRLKPAPPLAGACSGVLLGVVDIGRRRRLPDAAGLPEFPPETAPGSVLWSPKGIPPWSVAKDNARGFSVVLEMGRGGSGVGQRHGVRRWSRRRCLFRFATELVRDNRRLDARFGSSGS